MRETVLLTDLYELTMLQAYFAEHMCRIAPTAKNVDIRQRVRAVLRAKSTQRWETDPYPSGQRFPPALMGFGNDG